MKLEYVDLGHIVLICETEEERSTLAQAFADIDSGEVDVEGELFCDDEGNLVIDLLEA